MVVGAVVGAGSYVAVGAGSDVTVDIGADTALSADVTFGSELNLTELSEPGREVRVLGARSFSVSTGRRREEVEEERERSRRVLGMVRDMVGVFRLVCVWKRCFGG